VAGRTAIVLGCVVFAVIARWREPLGDSEWHSLHAPAVFVSQVAVPTLAPPVRPVLWHETPEQVSSFPDATCWM